MIRPEFLTLNGVIEPWDEGKVHLASEVALRGSNVFEGIRAYWNESTNSMRIIELEAHIARLQRSCETLSIPLPADSATMTRGISTLVGCLGVKSDQYIRLSVFLLSGGYSLRSQEMEVGWCATSVPVPSTLGEPKAHQAIVSKWRKGGSDVWPQGVKAGGAYFLGRLPRLEAILAKADEVLLLNQRGVLCETPGSNIVLVKKDRLVSPSPNDGALDGITLRTISRVLDINGERGEVSYRSVTPEELYDAAEVFTCGTLGEIGCITSVDGRLVGDGSCGPKSELICSLLKSAYEEGSEDGQNAVEVLEVSLDV